MLLITTAETEIVGWVGFPQNQKFGRGGPLYVLSKRDGGARSNLIGSMMVKAALR
jgi:hypothetical protein